jgi:hypothetical protein
MVSNLLQIAELLVPFMPETAEKIKGVFGSGMLNPLQAPLFPKEVRKAQSPSSPSSVEK